MSFKVEYKTLDSSNIDASGFGLSGVPLSAADVALDLIGGTAQEINGDFRVDGTSIKWDSSTYNLWGALAANDNIRVIYDRS